MSDSHPLRLLVGQLETTLDTAVEAAGGDQPASNMSALRNRELEDLAQRAWQLIQRVQGLVLVPVVAETDERRLFKTREYESASSSRDLVRSWLRCDPPVANKLVQVGKEAVTGRYSATAEALASGEIDVDHAARVVRAVKRLPTPVVDLDQRLEAEDTMLQVAKTTDPEVTHAAGHHLLEMVAPDEAANHLDAKAERERLAAEEARWFEVTSTPIAGCKELRLRLEASTMNTLTRLVESLTQPAITDPHHQNQDQGLGEDQGQDQSWVLGEEQGQDQGWVLGEDHDQDQVQGQGQVHGQVQGRGRVLEWDQVLGEARSELDRQSQETVGVPAGSGSPGNPPGSLNLAPIERRRADAMVEIITSVAQPHPADELNPAQLHRLADELTAAQNTQAGAGAQVAPGVEDSPGTQASPDPWDVQTAPDGSRTRAARGGALRSRDAQGASSSQAAQSAPNAQAGLDAWGFPNVPGARATQNLPDGQDAPGAWAGGRDQTAGWNTTEPALQSETEHQRDHDHETAHEHVHELEHEDEHERESEGVEFEGEMVDKQGGQPVLATAVSSGKSQGRDRDRGSGRVRGERPSVVVITTFDPVRQRFRAGEASSPGAPTTRLSPVEVEMAACEGMVTPVWMTRGQTPTSVASPSRYFRGKQLAALIARDRGCIFPSCSRGLRYVHGHHIVPVSQGGQTTVDNGALVCAHHHTVIHAPGGWTMRLADDGLPEFIPPYWIDHTRTPQRHARHQLRLPIAA